MSSPSQATGSDVLDVRGMRKPAKHPTIFARFGELGVGESFVLVNDHDPIHLHDEFDEGFPGGYTWDYLNREIRDFRIRITKLAKTALPRVLVDTADLPADAPAGAAWSIKVPDRELDSNIVVIPAGQSIEPHTGADLDVLVHVIAGSGTLVTERDEVRIAAGAVLFLPRRSLRGFRAGDHGLRYLTVHKKRDGLLLKPTTRD